jgi:CPA1 family monovalent cation:H+ antiporter
MHFEVVFVLLFVVATAVAILARKLRVPYTVALVLAGLGLGLTHWIAAPALTKELLFTVLLPGLLFEAAFHLDAKELLRNKLSISALAIPGLVAVLLLTALALSLLQGAIEPGFTFANALVFGAAVSATDPIAVVAVFRNLTVPRRLAVLVEGESLFNDGTGVVVFNLVLAGFAGTRFTALGAILEFFRVAGLGALIGLAIGFAGAHLIRRLDDALVEITLTVIVAYGSFVLGEELHVSGVIATVVAGVIVGSYAEKGMAPATKLAVEAFWSYLAFAFNSIVFLLIGFEVRPRALLEDWKEILIAWTVVIATRALVVFASAALLRPTRERISARWATLLSWAGIRGALSMVLVLALPANFPFRELIVNMTFGVVFLTIVVQGMTAGPLLKLLRIREQSNERV